ncbi:MAG: P22 phage major capsid protein family protein [Syntrophales bacterium]|nr:P22 phage major capsid protein family protein [Syntrophales bacterium]
MPNAIKTLSSGDITRKSLALLHNNLIFCKLINREYDNRFARSGAKNGGTLLIREPNQFTVRTGAVMDTQDIDESTQTLTLATQKGVDVNFSSAELTLSLDDFSDRILKPAMARLAADIDSTVLTGCAKSVYNIVYTTIGAAPDTVDVRSARAKLAKGLAPTNDRAMVMESLSMNAVAVDVPAWFQPGSEIAKAYDTGLMGRFGGFNFYETEMIPTIINGSRTDATPICNTTEASGITSGTATVTTTGAAGTVAVGDIFTIAGVYAVNPETKAVYEHLQQFVITAAHTNDASDVWAVSPTPISSGAKQNISVVSAGASKAVVFVAAGGSGEASTGYATNLGFQKGAFTMVTADLEMPKGVDFAAREVYDGISLRIVRNYDIVNDKFPCRIDVLFGYKAIRPEWAVRLPG